VAKSEAKPAPNIYVCERGWVLVGRPRPQARGDDALFVALDDAAVVRVWGTAAGLGELAQKGPLPGTRLDPEPGPVLLNVARCVYRIIPCTAEAWAPWAGRTS
jgi:hypothetical protein